MARSPSFRLPAPPVVDTPQPSRVRRAWGKVPYVERYQRQREDLLSAAERLAAARGIAGTSVASIVELAGVSKRVFYEHFGDKESCFVEVAARISADHLGSGIRAAEAVEGLDPREAVMRVIAALRGTRKIDPRLLEALQAEAGASAALAQSLADHHRGVVELFAALAARLGSPLPEHTLRLASRVLVHGVTALRAEPLRTREGLEDVATVACLALGLETASRPAP